MRLTPVTTLLVALTLTAAVAPAARAAVTRDLCARTAVLRDSPKGFVIARLNRPQRLQVQRLSADRRWALVVLVGAGTVGWLPAASVCRA
jgi:hypothetical protein